VGQPHPEAIPALLTRPPQDRDGFIDFAVGAWRVIGSPGFEADEGALRARAGASYDRGIFPDGTARQLVAILASGDRTEALRRLDVPTTVVHGMDDALIDVSGGRATAEAIPGARLELVEGMGHDLPRALWAAVDRADRGERGAGGGAAGRLTARGRAPGRPGIGRYRSGRRSP
jgi:pimeloyl-ACP methyl ester carboxylesterase